MAVLGAPVAAHAGMPAQEALLLNTLSSYNKAYDQAANQIQQSQVSSDFARRFCTEIPQGVVHDWIGDVDSITPTQDQSGVQISIDLPSSSLYGGPLGIELSLGNGFFYGIDQSDVIPIGPLVIPKSSPLYNQIISLRSGGYDEVEFSARFDPFTSLAACESAIGYSTYFSAVQLLSLRYIEPAS